MPFQPGNQEAKKGNKAKLYRRALLMELAAAGDDFKEMRQIARAHIDQAKTGDIAAIKEFADRLDGRAPQESTLNVNVAPEMSDDELARRIEELRGAGAIAGDGEAPVDPSQLN
jgi:hypothetical protein